MKLSIILPAYNEEASIGSVVEETLTSLQKMKKEGDFDDFQLIVVSDGSTDRTAEIVARYKEINLVSYKKNKGYGAALKIGFENAQGEVLGFMDADGTCRPAFFQKMLKKLIDSNADIIVGSRLGENSKMPKIRKLGNMIFAQIINFFYNVDIKDCASGMRLFRKNVLENKIGPLPDGLNFTPAMSCKALMKRNVHITDIPMPYEERKGNSKLHVVKDGIRFLKTIMEFALFYKPLRLMFFLGACFIGISFFYALGPLIQYFTSQNLEFSYIYRFITIIVALIMGVNFMLFGMFSQRLLDLVYHSDDCDELPGHRILNFMENPRPMFVLGSFFLFFAFLLNYQGLYNYLTKGYVMIHWILIVIGGILLLVGTQLIIFGLLFKILNLYSTHKMKNV